MGACVLILFRLMNEDTFGKGMVTITPALVPTHSTSRQETSDVMRRHAILCWRMISSVAK